MTNMTLDPARAESGEEATAFGIAFEEDDGGDTRMNLVNRDLSSGTCFSAGLLIHWSTLACGTLLAAGTGTVLLGETDTGVLPTIVGEACPVLATVAIL